MSNRYCPECGRNYGDCPVCDEPSKDAELARLRESLEQTGYRLDQAVQGRDNAQLRVRALRDAEQQTEAERDRLKDDILRLSERLRLRQERAEAERDRFADALAHQIRLHTQRPGHLELDRRACQTCKTFRELREHPSIAAAQARIHAAIAEALRTGNYAACYLADDGTPLAPPGDQGAQT